MAKKKSSGYLGLGWGLSIILAIIPPTNIVLGIITRIQKNKLILAILNFFLFPIFFVVDLISIIVNKKISWLI